MGTTRLVSRRRQDQGFGGPDRHGGAGHHRPDQHGSITLKRWGILGTSPVHGGRRLRQGAQQPLGAIADGIPLSLVSVLAYGAVLLMALLPLLPGLQENKADLSRRTWWGLFSVSLGMAVFSAVLLGLMVFSIQAFCFFCVLSAVLSVALFVLSVIGGGWDDPGQLIFRGVLLALAVLLSGLVWPQRSTPAVNSPQRPALVLHHSSPRRATPPRSPWPSTSSLPVP